MAGSFKDVFLGAKDPGRGGEAFTGQGGVGGKGGKEEWVTGGCGEGISVGCLENAVKADGNAVSWWDQQQTYGPRPLPNLLAVYVLSEAGWNRAGGKGAAGRASGHVLEGKIGQRHMGAHPGGGGELPGLHAHHAGPEGAARGRHRLHGPVQRANWTCH